MAIIRSVHLLAFVFDTQASLPREVVQRLELLRGRGVIRFLDSVLVSKDEAGALHADPIGVDLIAVSDARKSLLWQLLRGDGGDNDDEADSSSSVASFELRSAGEVGLDLAAVENLPNLIDPGTSALFMLVEPKWEGELLDAVLATEGLPLVFGCLEPETMLVIGGTLALAVGAANVAEHMAEIRGAAILDALASASNCMTVSEVVSALVEAGVIDPSDVGSAVGALAVAGLIPPSTLERATARADVAVADDARAGAFGVHRAKGSA